MKSIKSAVALVCLSLLGSAAFASDYEGAESRKGSSRGEACEKAKRSASISARAAGSRVNTINTGSCECDKVSDSLNFGWECTVSWQATAKRD